MRSTRQIPRNPGAGTVLFHMIGDPHVPVLSANRQSKFSNDLSGGLLPTPTARICVGDFSNETGGNINDTTNDNLSKAWRDALPNAGSIPFYTAIGNHDIWQANRTATVAAAAYGQASLNQNIDFGLCRVLIVNPDSVPYPSDTTTIQITQTTLDWLDAQLAASTKDCIIVCHAPLKNSVTDPSVDNVTIFDSNTSGFFVKRVGDADDAYIRTLLGNRTKARAWVCGHTHNHAYTASIFTTQTVGSRTIAHICCPVLYYVTPGVDARDPIWSVFVEYVAGSTVNVYLRNHAAGIWDGIDASRVTTL